MCACREDGEFADYEGQRQDAILREQRLVRVQELREERGEEQQRLGIARADQEASRIIRAQPAAAVQLRFPDLDRLGLAEEGPDAEPDEIERADHLDDGEGE